MSTPIPRLRMFAGPNGSGKSTLKSYLPAPLLGVYLNPDDIEAEIRKQGVLDLNAYGLGEEAAQDARRYFSRSAFLAQAGMTDAVARLGFGDGRIDFSAVAVNSYLASVAGDFLRQQLLARRESFTFETVMSHPGKVDLLAEAQAAGYRTYLYYVATEDPAINISRVRNRVGLGGHDVPEAKIVERYHRSLDLLMAAIRHANRAYIFDNSGAAHTWLAEITHGRRLEQKSDRIPAWFARAVLDKTA